MTNFRLSAAARAGLNAYIDTYDDGYMPTVSHIEHTISERLMHTSDVVQICYSSAGHGARGLRARFERRSRVFDLVMIAADHMHAGTGEHIHTEMSRERSGFADRYRGTTAKTWTPRSTGWMRPDKAHLIADTSNDDDDLSGVALFQSATGRRRFFLVFRLLAGRPRLLPVSRSDAAKWLLEHFEPDILGRAWVRAAA